MQQDSTADRYTRGRIANRYLRDRTLGREADSLARSLEESVLAAYLDQQVRRRLLQYLLAGVNGVDPFGQMVHTVVQLAFRILLSQGRDELEDAMNIRCQTRITNGYSRSGRPPGLGELGLGRTSALGSSSADAGSVVSIDTEISEKQLTRLYDHPWAIPHMLRVLDTVVPMNLNFKIRFRMHVSEGGFRLTSAAAADTNRCMLGVTTRLPGQNPRSKP